MTQVMPHSDRALQPLWTPSAARAEATEMTRFRRDLARHTGERLPDYDALHAWSVAHPAELWGFYARWAGIAMSPPERILGEQPMPGTRWFAGATLSYTAELLAGDGDALAVIALDEAGGERRVTRGELRVEVARCAAGLRTLGVGRGDRVAACVVNGVEAVVILLAAAAVGAIFASASPDASVDGTIERFAQIAPRVLFASGSYLGNGRPTGTLPAVRRLVAALDSLACTVIIAAPCDDTGEFVTWAGFLDDEAPELACELLPFDHPLAILYTSGTTGLPKCLVHGAGGTLLTHAKEQQLHCDIRPGDVVLYYTTTGWMMWNWLVSALARLATIVLYEGGLAYPSREAFWELVERHGVSHLGLGAAYLESSRRRRLRPCVLAPLSALRCVLSTGSPLSPDGFRWVYDAVKPDVHLASISGGTDIVGCFMLGDPSGPVYAGQIQRPALGVDLAVYDEDGRELHGAMGELVCRNPIPSMPLALWHDPDGARYRETYFSRFPGVWCHGDLIERTAQGGIIVHGRSDATLKPGGVRIGTAELYRPLQSLPVVVDALAAGKREAGDVAIWLFVVLAAGHQLDDELESLVRTTIRQLATPLAAPRRIFQVEELPRTRSGKLAEVAVARLINGDPIPNRAALANPDTLTAIGRAVEEPARRGAER
jgi:acetoacetyl-CoA synthetase